ncbi:MAG TPA: histidinol-phosphate transaminase [Candidatus Acidoferrales bacterium]|nr:histidinol-phosphate transaminase [Candidatus Acidoferrales bacterium]
MGAKSNFKRSVLELSPYNVSGHPAKIKLNQNESPYDIPSELKKEIIEEFLRIGWNRYPEVFSTSLPKKFSDLYDLPEQSFIAANGSNELIYTVGMSIVKEGVDVLIPQPTFYLFEKVAKILEGNIIRVYSNSDLTFDENGILEHARRMQNGLVIISSPNNPTGKSASREFIIELLKSTGAMVLIDEAYIEFSEHQSSIALTKSFKNLVVLRTFSKAFSLAGLRIGYLTADPETASQILKVKIPFTVNPLSEFTALKLLEHRSLFEERVTFLKKQKVSMMDALRKIDEVEVVDSDSNFFLFATRLSAKDMFEDLLERQSVLIRDVSSYPLLEKYLRVNVGSREESEYFVESLHRCLGRKIKKQNLRVKIQ